VNRKQSAKIFLTFVFLRKVLWATLTTMALTVLLANVAPAALIVDTGSSGSGNQWVLGPGQWLAGQFSLTQNYSITEIQGLFGSIFGNGHDGEVKAVLHSDNGLVPGSELLSQTFTCSSTDHLTWQGPSGLNWSLTTGTYWLAFEVDSASLAYTGFAVFATNPLAHYAFAVAGLPTYYNYDDLRLSMRIYGTPSAPLPPGIVLFGTGLIGLGVFRSRFKKA
jgi:hypothetical protein